MQRKCACGNHTVSGECAACAGKKLTPQRKLTLGASHDPLELEADRVANLITSMPSHQAINRTPVHIQRASGARNTEGGSVPPSVETVIRSSGRAMDPAVRSDMEQRFGYDFSGVRIHTGALAERSAREIQAHAYTAEKSIVFGAGQYSPGRPDGKRLLAHELTHVIQQAAATTASSPPAAQLGVAKSSVIQRAVSPDMPGIREQLSTGIFNSVSPAEAHSVLIVLKRLRQASLEDFGDTVAAMEREGLVTRLLTNVSQADRLNEQDTLRQIANARVFTRERRSGNTTVTTTVTGSCSPERYQMIFTSTLQALAWLDRAIVHTDAFLSAPGAPGNTTTRQALNQYFSSSAPNIARHIRARLNHIRRDIRTVDPFILECHDQWDPICANAGAYIPGGRPEELIFCTSFFRGDRQRQTETIVHEMAHTQVGGAHITDRGYASDRVLRFLSTAEALTNAESYGLYVEHLATGQTPAMPIPRDTEEDCPADWWAILQRAIARGQRANRNALVAFGSLTPSGLQNWTASQRRLVGGSGQSDIDRVKNVYQQAETRFDSAVSFECEPGGGGRCDSAETYWYALGDLHICPSWRTLGSNEAWIVSLLSGLYGYFGLESDNSRRYGYARLAYELTAQRWPVPTLAEVLGSAAWRTDLLRIHFRPTLRATLPRTTYEESGNRHDRLSNDLPVYQGPDFQRTSLPFNCQVLFALDTAATPRPAPFTPPRANILFEFNGRRGAFRRAEQDPRADYTGANAALRTTFPTDFNFSLAANGTLHTRFELIDPDSGITRVYDDTMAVEVERLRDIIAPGSTHIA